ncbi:MULTISPECIES: hypothetical protein [Bacillus cereus group]|uniref:hypothetical protein n=1 Tax=Bacillus cereus group TaxID=86661 RepID=UPI0022E79A58|nr:hypothetical protein [Bacillus cereus group sp. Bc253]MDA2157992.1 hypothetical protein [Bacillus cereus group sp. Bc253]
MDLYGDSELLLVAPVGDIDEVKVVEYKENALLITIEDEEFLVIKRTFNNDVLLGIPHTLSFEDFDVNFTKTIEDFNDFASSATNFGGKGSLIIDMQGISNFILARSLEFYDYNIRKILLKLKFIKPNTEYLRIGASGAKTDSIHPGGEVVEYSVINGNDGSGVSQNLSGYLSKDENYSKSTKLNDADKTFLREERVVYSHTAILKKCNENESESIHLKVKVNKGKKSLLDLVTLITDKLSFKSYAIQIKLTTRNTVESNTLITGRVLKHVPYKAFESLQDATDIAIEQTFPLGDSQVMFGFGTKYNRWEPEWTEFTNGRIYERRGHIHATIIGKEDIYQQHKTFHLRDVLISYQSDVEIILTPIEDVYKIYPIFKSKDNYYCKATLKSVDTIIDNMPSQLKVKI